MARCPRPGFAPANCSSMTKRRRQDSLRASWLEMNSSNGIGLFLVHNPPGERKSGMPHSVEMPAPVNGRIVPAAWTMSPSRAIAVSRSGAIILDEPSFITTRPCLTFYALIRPAEVLDAVPAYDAARAQSRRGARLLLQQARAKGGPPPGGRQKPIHIGVSRRRRG